MGDAAEVKLGLNGKWKMRGGAKIGLDIPACACV